MIYNLALWLAILLFCSQMLHSQVTETEIDTVWQKLLPQVEVIAFRHVPNLNRFPASVHIIPRENLLRNVTGDLSAVFHLVPGVQMQVGTMNTNKLTIRGVGSRSPYATTRTRAYWDNIPLSAGEGVTILDDIEWSFVERIEVVKGTHSALYGSGLGGVVRFSSLGRPASLSEAHTQWQIGNNGYNKYQLLTQFARDNGFFNMGVARVSGDGFRENSRFYRNSLFVSGAYQKRSDWRYILKISDVNAQIPSSIDEQTFLHAPHRAAPNWLRVEGFKQYRRALAGLSVQTPLNESFSHTLALSGSWYNHYELRPFNILDDHSWSLTMVNSWQYKGSSFTLTGGVEWLQEDYAWKIFSNEAFVLQQEALHNRNQWNVFLNYEQQLGELFLLSSSVNWNLTHSKLTDKMKANPFNIVYLPNRNHLLSPHLGIRYLPNKHWSVFVSAAHGFSNPTTEESLNSDGNYNMLLKPEQGWTFEAGGHWVGKENMWRVDFSVYHIALNHLLVTQRLAEDVFSGANVGSAFLRGVELQSHFNPLPSWQIKLMAALSENRFLEHMEEGGIYNNNHLPGIPKATFTGVMRYTIGKHWHLNTTYVFTGKQFMNDSNTKTYDAWNRIDATISYQQTLANHIRIEASITCNNVLNAHYASMLLINAPSFAGRAPRYYYPAMPRHFVLSVRLKM